MIRRKYVIIFLFLYVLFTISVASASLLSPFISKLAPAAALATGSGGGFTIPAKIIATASGGGNVASWISLAVPGATAAKVAVAVLSVAGALAADYVMLKGAAWFAANNISKNAAGDFEEKVTRAIPNGKTAADFADGQGEIMSSVYESMSVCAAFLDTIANYPTGQLQNVGCVNYWSDGSYGYVIGTILDRSDYSYDQYKFYYIVDAGTTHQESSDNPLTPAQLEAKLADSLAAENADAKNVAKAALDVTAAAMDNPSHPVAQNTTTYNNINNYLIQNITNNQLTNLEAAATPNVGDQVLPDTEQAKVENLTAAQIAAAVAAALANQGLSASQIAAAIAAAQSAATGGLTQAELATTLSSEGLTAAQIAAAIAAANPAITQTQVKTAVKEAIDDETGITPPVDPIISLPDKLSLTTVLNDFWTSVQALPIFNVLNGITITTSGSSNLCIDLPAAYGGQRCYNAANVQDELNIIGSVILGLTTVVSFIGIFKG